jgi:hypothetical protein
MTHSTQRGGGTPDIFNKNSLPLQTKILENERSDSSQQISAFHHATLDFSGNKSINANHKNFHIKAMTMRGNLCVEFLAS